MVWLANSDLTCVLVLISNLSATLMSSFSKVDILQLLGTFLCLPPMSGGDILFFPVRLSVRLSVCPSVRHKSCPLYNLKTVKDFSMKLGTLVNHDETMCHAQEP